MTRDTIMPLESARLAQYAEQIACYVCEEANTFDAELCRYCAAPMALAHQASNQGIFPQMVATIGPSGAGKTVYLGMLMDMLSRQKRGMQMLARGAFSISLQQNTISALNRLEFPEKTPSEPDRWHWVHCQVKVPRQRRPVELIMPDVAGEALIEEVDHPHTYPVIRAFLKKCSGIMLLVDSLRVHSGTRDQDYFTMKLLSYLLELDDDPKTGWAHRPIALIFSKADQCEECFDNPRAFAEAHTTGLAQHCNERFSKCEFFATSVAGACALRNTRNGSKVAVPLRIEPRGIITPFQWLVGRLSS